MTNVLLLWSFQLMHLAEGIAIDQNCTDDYLFTVNSHNIYTGAVIFSKIDSLPICTARFLLRRRVVIIK